MNTKDLLRLTKATMAHEGFSWKAMSRSAKQIVIYGSQATNASRETSDLDILCVGNGRRYKSKTLHIIWVPESRLQSRRWLGSELATHIAAYGKWIKGENTWAKLSRPSRYALGLIRKRVIARAKALEDYWNLLLPRYRHKHVDRLRRDIQRLAMMKQGQPPVASGTLDAQWRSRGVDRAWKNLLARTPDLAKDVKPVLLLAEAGSRGARGHHLILSRRFPREAKHQCSRRRDSTREK